MNPNAIVKEMMAKDAFSQWLGIEIDAIEKGGSKVTMTVREEMVNGFGIAHGGITFSLADSAFAFASNSQGRHAVSIECNINHISQVRVGDVLTAEATESSRSNKLAVYHVVVSNQSGDKVALFKGMVYRTSTDWEMP